MTWETVIGLEVHAQLKTKSKLFSSTATAFGAQPNSQTSFIDAGLPGVLPVLNQEAVYMAIQFGLAIHAEINDLSFFERKNYFYPDLPKGYQISQFQRPIISNGQLDIVMSDHTSKSIHIQRAHLEEDAGKSLHELFPTATGIDLNRAGMPLLEIVTSPCLHSAKDAICYLKTLHQLLRFLNICDGNMQEGSFRCDVNLSLRRKGHTQLGTRTEIKNLNSFRFIEKAIHYEELRHQDLLESGQTIIQETRLYCPNTNTTQVLRSKENENDYRYFPDPDLLPIKITADVLKRIKAIKSELPKEIRHRLSVDDNLTQDDIDFLLTSPAHIQYYDAVKLQSSAPQKTIINWLKGAYTAMLHELGRTFDSPPISAKNLACFLDRIAQNVISAKVAKTIFRDLVDRDKTVDQLIKDLELKPVKDNQQMIEIIRKTIEHYPQQVADFRAGKEKLLAFFVGQIMKQTKGQANPAEINALLRECLMDL